MATELDRPAAPPGVTAHEPRHQNEREGDGEARRREVEPERDRQLIALTEAVTGRRNRMSEHYADRPRSEPAPRGAARAGGPPAMPCTTHAGRIREAGVGLPRL